MNFTFRFELGWLGVLAILPDEAGDFSQLSRSPIRLRFLEAGLGSLPFPRSKSCAAVVGSPFDFTSASRISSDSG